MSAQQLIPTDEIFQDFFNENPFDRNYYVNDLSVHPIHWERIEQLATTEREKAYDSIIQGILDEYDFIAVTERMDESLVVMSRLLRLPLEDLLYVVTDNLSGSFVGHGSKEERSCIYIVPSF